MRVGLIGAFVASLAVAAVASGTPAVLAQNDGASSTDAQIKADVQRRLSGLDVGSSQVSVTVQDGVVTLAGMVPTLWVKEEAIRKARGANRVQSLVSDLTIPRAENDETLVKQVGERIRQYDRYSVYDSIDGRVNQGVVSLNGAVTQPEKLSDILERVAKVKGVQAINNKIEVLPTSQSDDRLRRAIADAIYRDPVFVNYSMADPPIHVVVNNGHVTLIGFVRAQEEIIKAESAARSVFGVLALENKVQIPGKPTRAR